MKTLLIAEVGVNHNGSINRALEMIEIAAECGADLVKFQAWKAELLTSRFAERAEYQISNTGSQGTQLELLKSLELRTEDYPKLIEQCNKCGVEFLCTPMDLPSIQMLADLKVKRLKLPSGELTNAPFLLAAGRTKLPVFLSTGMASLEEIEAALGALAWGITDKEGIPDYEGCRKLWSELKGKQQLKELITILHCTTEYPAPLKDINLLAMKKIFDCFGLPVGYSDHSEGITVSIAAAAMGATVVEKHFTLDRNLSGPDHLASIEPDQLKQMSEALKEVSLAMGKSEKTAVESEIKNIPIARKSIVAARPITKGEPFSDQNITVKRPGSGVSPWKYWEYLGKPADRDYQEDELIESLP